MIEDTQCQCSGDHVMNTRLSSDRFKRSSVYKIRALQRKYRSYYQRISFRLNNRPCKDELGNVIIQFRTSIPTMDRLTD